MALTIANETALEIAHFNAELHRFRDEYGNATLGELLDILRRSPHQFDDRVVELRRGIRELSLL